MLKKRIIVLALFISLLAMGCTSNSTSSKKNENNQELTQDIITKDDVEQLNTSMTNIQTQMDMLNDALNELVEAYHSESQGSLVENNNDDSVSAMNSDSGASSTPQPSAEPTAQSSQQPVVQSSTDPSPTSSPVTTNTSVQLPKDFSKYQEQVDDIQKQVTNNKNTNISKYNELKEKINVIDDVLEAFDEKLESYLRNGTISVDDYKVVAKVLSRLEDQLEQAEDQLEDQFNIAD